MTGSSIAGELVVAHIEGPDLDRIELQIVIPEGRVVEVPIPQVALSTPVGRLKSKRRPSSTRPLPNLKTDTLNEAQSPLTETPLEPSLRKGDVISARL
jgi:hypothetical protein